MGLLYTPIIMAYSCGLLYEATFEMSLLTLDSKIEQIADACRKSLFFTAQILCGFSKITPRTHYPIIKNLENHEIKRKLLCVPRGTFKSSIGSVAYPIWLLLNNPNLRIYIDSEVSPLSVALLGQISKIFESKEFLTYFGNWKGDRWNQDELLINKRTIIKKEASITAGSVGTVRVGQHYDVYILDDPNSPNNSNTHEQRKKVIDHYQYAQSILDPNGIFVLIGTRYSEDDLIGWIIRNELGFKNEVEMKKTLKKELGVYYYE